MGREGAGHYSGSPLGGTERSEARFPAPEEAAPTELLAHLFRGVALMARAWDAKKFDSVYLEFVCPYLVVREHLIIVFATARVTKDLSNGFMI